MTEAGTRSPFLWRAAAALALAALAVGGVSACAASTRTDTQHSPVAAPSTAAAPRSALHMISNKGHELAFHVTAGHLPAIVLDAGGGMDSSYWKKVAPELAAKTGSEVITYDRSGEGKSPEVPGPWKAQNAVSDLAAGLTQLGVTHNVVLVSHSLAGEIATYFVAKYPHWISGAVLVDASLPQFYTDGETARIVAANTPQLAALQAHQPLSQASRQLIAEAANYGPVHHAYHRMSWPASVPAIAIVSSQTPFPTTLDAQRWRAAQAQFVHAGANRRLVVAAHSSHDIPLDRPDVVIAEVQDMVNQVR